jgi:hypothetical protein
MDLDQLPLSSPFTPVSDFFTSLSTYKSMYTTYEVMYIQEWGHGLYFDILLNKYFPASSHPFSEWKMNLANAGLLMYLLTTIKG